MKTRIASKLLIAAIALLSVAECRPDEPAAGEKSPASAMLGKEAGQLRDDNGVKLELVWCPPGKFRMGSPKSEESRTVYSPADKPPYSDEGQVDVALTKGFWLGRFEVTQDEWQRVMETAPWKSKDAEYVNQGANFPATYVTWNDAVAFCRKLTGQERSADRLPAGWEFTLPTEAQWEYACRAGTTTAFSFGNDESKLGQFGWFRDERSGRKSGLPDWNPRSDEWAQLVGRRKPNPWGLYDVHGNVWEWCRDGYSVKLPGGSDPERTKDEGWGRVMRGGSWFGHASRCRSASRLWCNPHTGSNLPSRMGSNSIGFRVSLAVAE
jgi:formylglycine-generating enzyme required for sulfatase activity